MLVRNIPSWLPPCFLRQKQCQYDVISTTAYACMYQNAWKINAESLATNNTLDALFVLASCFYILWCHKYELTIICRQIMCWLWTCCMEWLEHERAVWSDWNMERNKDCIAIYALAAVVLLLYPAMGVQWSHAKIKINVKIVSWHYKEPSAVDNNFLGLVSLNANIPCHFDCIILCHILLL